MSFLKDKSLSTMPTVYWLKTKLEDYNGVIPQSISIPRGGGSSRKVYRGQTSGGDYWYTKRKKIAFFLMPSHDVEVKPLEDHEIRTDCGGFLVLFADPTDMWRSVTVRDWCTF
ncbi:hypothetical protein YC2023_039120 [Brassica napus]